ncbi:hypothetical protein NDI47_19530 [Microcoleus vaginatus GB1-A2]|uniref:hypothetical protein n=1 Tax=Microcoleus vaginatus TaxID=119532 RepID=UPI0016862F7D|nr:hypothetical protein [Microcoleus sp. FACHB-61]
MKFRCPRDIRQISPPKLQVVGERTRLTHHLATLQGDGKNAGASPRLELFAASDFGVIFKLDR